MDETTGIMCAWGLMRPDRENHAHNDDVEVDHGTKKGDTDDNWRKGWVGFQEVAKEDTTVQQECGLQHQRQRLHDMVDAVQLPLSILAVFDAGPSRIV